MASVIHNTEMTAPKAYESFQDAIQDKGVLALFLIFALMTMKQSNTTVQSQIGQMGAIEEAQLGIAAQTMELSKKKPIDTHIFGIQLGSTFVANTVQHESGGLQTQQTGTSSMIGSIMALMSSIESVVRAMSEVGKYDIQTITCVKTR